jgi:hypothetical protein
MMGEQSAISELSERVIRSDADGFVAGVEAALVTHK